MLNNATDGLLKVIVNNSLAHARKASIDMNSFVSHQLEIIKPFTNSVISKNPKSQEYKKLIEEFDNQYVSIEKIIVCEKYGQIIWVSNNTLTTPYSNITEIRDKLENRKYILYNGHNHQGKKQKASITLITKINENDPDNYALVFIELNMLQFTNILSDNVVGNSTHAYILDENNSPAVYYPEDCVASDISMLKEKYIEKFDYGVFNIDSKSLEKPILATYLPVVAQNGWKILFVQNQEEVYELVSSFQKNLYWILFITISVAVIIALIISQNIALPILQVTKGTNELASGRYDVRIKIKSSDEVGRLANNFNFMADSLATKMEELRIAYLELQDKAELITQQNRDLDRKVFETTTLYKISHMMSEVGFDIDKLLDIIIEKSIEAAKATKGSLMLLDDAQEFLEVQRVIMWDETLNRAVPIENFKKNIKIKPGEGIAGKVLVTGEMLIINQPENDPNFKQFDDNERFIQNICCIPLKVNNITFGVINIVDKVDGSSFEKRDTDLLMAMVNQAAIVLDNTKLFKLAITDGLTGLYLVRHFKNKLASEEKRAKRYNKIFSILFFDIDHFKKFNDTYGHHIGDEVLKQVATIFKNSLRDGIDLAARYGGEEMIALLPETDIKGAYIVAERLRNAVANHEFTGYKTSLHVTISIGISEFPSSDTDSLELIRKADTALYQSKEGGRNKTTIYTTEMGVVSEK
ncbi:MAG: diguanylate cyclase [Candidatus Riflebacteria bacterium]|nr:diguanylate cyclase [Candidatus Riflebacteria bacterium]